MFPAKTICLDIYVDEVVELKGRFRGYFFQVTIFGFVARDDPPGGTDLRSAPSDIDASERWLLFVACGR